MEHRNHLTALPAELRNTIYEIALHEPDYHYLHVEAGVVRPKNQGFMHPCILAVSRQIREEALPIYFNTNKFMINTKMAELPIVAEWVTRTVENCGLKAFETPERRLLIVIFDAEWATFESIFPLAEMARATGMDEKMLLMGIHDNLEPMRNPSAEERQKRKAVEESICALQGVLQGALRFGLQARTEGLDAEDFEVAFQWSANEMREEEDVKKYLRVQE